MLCVGVWKGRKPIKWLVKVWFYWLGTGGSLTFATNCWSTGSHLAISPDWIISRSCLSIFAIAFTGILEFTTSSTNYYNIKPIIVTTHKSKQNTFNWWLVFTLHVTDLANTVHWTSVIYHFSFSCMLRLTFVTHIKIYTNISARTPSTHTHTECKWKSNYRIEVAWNISEGYPEIIILESMQCYGQKWKYHKMYTQNWKQ